MRKRGNVLSLSKGFTLIELLVVVAIIAILSAMGLSVFTNAQRKARDARRRADLNAIQSAAEQYYLQNSTYPTSVQVVTFISGNVLPTDPRAGAAYIGLATMTTTGYTVCADTEISAGGVVDNPYLGTVSDVCVRQLQ